MIMSEVCNISEFLNKYKQGGIIYRQVIHRLFDNPDKAISDMLETGLVHADCMCSCPKCLHLVCLESSISSNELYCENCDFSGVKYKFMTQIVYIKE